MRACNFLRAQRDCCAKATNMTPRFHVALMLVSFTQHREHAKFCKVAVQHRVNLGWPGLILYGFTPTTSCNMTATCKMLHFGRALTCNMEGGDPFRGPPHVAMLRPMLLRVIPNKTTPLARIGTWSETAPGSGMALRLAQTARHAFDTPGKPP